MKTFKFIASIILGVLMIPLVLFSLFIGLYNIIPGIRELGLIVNIHKGLTTLLGVGATFPMWLGILIPCLAFACVIAFIVVTWKSNSMYTNIYLTILKWCSVVLIIGAPIATIIIAMVEAAAANTFGSTVIQNLTLQLTSVNFIVLGGFVAFYIIIKIFGGKITADLNRALTAARTAKELKQPGRTPDVLLNIYKMINFIFPELLVVGMFIALFINTSLAIFFWSMLIGLGVFVLINIWMDGNIRREAKRRIKAENASQVQAIASATKK